MTGTLVAGVSMSCESSHADRRMMEKEDESTRLEDVSDHAGGTTSGGVSKPAGTPVTEDCQDFRNRDSSSLSTSVTVQPRREKCARETTRSSSSLCVNRHTHMFARRDSVIDLLVCVSGLLYMSEQSSPSLA